jgi:hypothetical protein
MAELSRRVGLMTALKEAYSSRSYALRDLIQLHLANYYGSDMEKPQRNIQSARTDDLRRQQGELIRRERSS